MSGDNDRLAGAVERPALLFSKRRRHRAMVKAGYSSLESSGGWGFIAGLFRVKRLTTAFYAGRVATGAERKRSTSEGAKAYRDLRRRGALKRGASPAVPPTLPHSMQ